MSTRFFIRATVFGVSGFVGLMGLEMLLEPFFYNTEWVWKCFWNPFFTIQKRQDYGAIPSNPLIFLHLPRLIPNIDILYTFIEDINIIIHNEIEDANFIMPKQNESNFSETHQDFQ